MFEPLSDFIRLRRKQLGMTQEKLAALAKVSRRQLSLLEDGHNTSLLFLTKIAKVLEVTDIPVGNLRIFAAPPELAAVMRSAEAVETMKQAFATMGDSAETIRKAGASLDELVAKALEPPPSTQAIDAAADALANLPTGEGAAAVLGTESHPARAETPDAAESAAEPNADSAGWNGS